MKREKYIELNHIIENDMITYKGLPGPKICDFWSREYSSRFYDGDTSFQIGKIELVANTGTYIDTPFHRYKEGDDLSAVFLDKLVDLEGLVIHVPYTETLEIRPDHFRSSKLFEKAVLIHTGWDQFWRTEKYFTGHPFITSAAANYLLEQKVKLVGIDSYNVDDTRGKTRPAHSILLGNNICIVEHMTCLDHLPAEGFRFFATPPRISGMGSFPVRAFAVV